MVRETSPLSNNKLGAPSIIPISQSHMCKTVCFNGDDVSNTSNFQVYAYNKSS